MCLCVTRVLTSARSHRSCGACLCPSVSGADPQLLRGHRAKRHRLHPQGRLGAGEDGGLAARHLLVPALRVPVQRRGGHREQLRGQGRLPAAVRWDTQRMARHPRRPMAHPTHRARAEPPRAERCASMRSSLFDDVLGWPSDLAQLMERGRRNGKTPFHRRGGRGGFRVRGSLDPQRFTSGSPCAAGWARPSALVSFRVHLFCRPLRGSRPSAGSRVELASTTSRRVPCPARRRPPPAGRQTQSGEARRG